MNNGLGINFFRYLKEEDEQNWVQVFAKLPFDDVEISQKGSIFGVVKTKKIDGWSELEMEMTAWVDQYFNGVEGDLVLSDFYSAFKDKYSQTDCVWITIFGNSKKRMMRALGVGESSLVIKRGNATINLSNNLDSEKILSGELMLGDVITMGIGETSILSDVDLDNMVSSVVYGYIKIHVLEVVGGEIGGGDELSKEVVFEEPKPSLATNKYVGKADFFSRLKEIFKQREALVVSSDQSKSKRKKIAFLLGVVFVSLLVVSLVLGGAKKSSLEADKKWVEFSEPIEKIVSEAVGIAKINVPGAKSMVEEARGKFLSGKSAFDDSTKLAELEKKIEDSWVLVSGEKNADLVEVVNLELIRAGIGASRISFATTDLYSVVSSENGIVMSVVLTSKEMKVLAGKGAGLGWIDSVLNNDKAYVLTKGGIFVAGNESDSLVFDSAVIDPVSLSFFGSSLYVLERGNKEVFKYSVGESGFGERQRWLKEGQLISTVPVDMDIDVDIWILGQDGSLERYRRGVRESFSLTGLPNGVEVEKITVETDGERIALLSSKKATVYICSKTTGICDKQLKNDKLSGARDVVFGDDGKLYVLFAGSIGMLN